MNSGPDRRPDPRRADASDGDGVSPETIEGCLRRLRARLTGPEGVKGELLTEVRDGLHDAAQAYRCAGYPDEEARRRAVADFGDLDVVAAEMQEELDIAQGRATASHASIVLPLLLLAWQLVHWLRPWPVMDASWAAVFGALGYTAGAVNLIAIAGAWYVRFITTRRPRPFRRPLRGRRVLGAFVLASLAAYGGVTVVIASAAAVVSRDVLLTPAVASATVLSLVLCLVLAVSARRCLARPL